MPFPFSWCGMVTIPYHTIPGERYGVVWYGVARRLVMSRHWYTLTHVLGARAIISRVASSMLLLSVGAVQFSVSFRSGGDTLCGVLFSGEKQGDREHEIKSIKAEDEDEDKDEDGHGRSWFRDGRRTL